MRTAQLMTLLCACAVSFSIATASHAAPPTDDSVDIKGLKKVFQFNLIGHPKTFTGSCGQGHRMFVTRGDKHAHIKVVDHNDGWHIEDCNATKGNQGELHIDGFTVVYDEEGNRIDIFSDIFIVVVRILGKPDGRLHICADTEEQHAADEFLGDEHGCVLGTFELNRNKGTSKFTLAPADIFTDETQNVIWSLDANNNFRIAQLRVYRVEQ